MMSSPIDYPIQCPFCKTEYPIRDADCSINPIVRVREFLFWRKVKNCHYATQASPDQSIECWCGATFANDQSMTRWAIEPINVVLGPRSK